jgi:methylase of polypeptide subunit release factors
MSAINRTRVFSAIHTVGGLLPADMLARIGEGKDVPGSRPADYLAFGSRSVQDEAERHWDYLRSVWTELRDRLPVAPEADVPVDATGVAVTQWLLPLFDELGFGALTPLGATGITSDDGSKTFPVSHRWTHVPVHLTAWQHTLDRRVAGAVPGQSLLQECLNRTEAHLWGIVSNGRQLRLLRDSSALATSAYVEFDLEAIFDGELFSEFVLLYRLMHVSRFAVAEGAAPSACWLERWRGEAITSGARALDQLSEGVRKALVTLGTGFLRHPDNATLRDDVDTAGVHTALLRLVYRLLFVFVAEDRDVLHGPAASEQARHRYAAYFSTARLRAHALRRRGTAHHDLYDGLRVVLDALGDEHGRPELGLPGLGGIFDPTPADEPLRGLKLANEYLLDAARHLARVRDVGSRRWRTIDYRHLDAEELGSIYESLLERRLEHSPTDVAFELRTTAGNARKTTGSYYTPSSLIELVLDSALDPVIDDAVKRGEQAAAGALDPTEAIVGELLALTVCDPACGSGHFLVASARRIAKRVAAVREGNPEPTLPAVRTALHEVIARCIYGVDLNPMAVELAKVSLWLEALEPGKPLSFLDAHVRCGNALIGATPALLRKGIPEKAFTPIIGDDARFAADLAKRSRNAQMSLFEAAAEVPVANADLARGFRTIATAPADTLADVRTQSRLQADLEGSPQYYTAREAADAWCAAFLWHKRADAPPAITQDMFLALQAADDREGRAATRAEIIRLRDDYRFLHWHLAFPEIFTVPVDGIGVDERTGWAGGFSCVVGNPPWERVKLQDKEFFATHGHDNIVNAKTAAIRRRMIQALADEGSPLHDAYNKELRISDGISHVLRNGGRHPLTGQGDINTYSVFAETFRMIVGWEGAAGIVTPTGLATDKTTAPFFRDLAEKQALSALHDFVTNPLIWQEIGHGRFRFAVSIFHGDGRPVDRVLLSFLNKDPASDPKERAFEVSPQEIALVNPNTGTLPIFNTRADAEITLGVYRRYPVLIEDAGERNPWGLSFARLFDMANDSGSFHQPDDLEDAVFDGWSYHRGGAEFLPLYEAKLVAHFDHRLSSYALRAPGSQDTELPRLTDDMHDDPNMEPLARYWVTRSAVEKALAGAGRQRASLPGRERPREHDGLRQKDARWNRDWLLGWRDIARSSDMRTFVPSVLPTTAVGHVFPVAFPADPAHGPLLHAVWSSLAFDYVARQKLSGTHMTYNIVKQLACPAPATFATRAPWQPDRSLAEWVVPYVLELSYTSWRLRPYAEEMHDSGPPFRWDPERRALLRADLDAAFLHVYGLTRPEAEHVLDSFFVVRKYEERDHGEYRTRRLVLDAYDRMAVAMAGGAAWAPLAEVPAGQGARHPARLNR